MRVEPGLYIRNGIYYIEYADEQGIRRRLSTKTGNKLEARAILASRRSRVREAVFFGRKVRPEMSFEELVAKAGKYQRDHGLRSYESWFLSSSKCLLKSLKGLLLEEVTPEKIEAFKTRRLNKDGVKGSTVNHDLACLRKMFNLAIQWELVDKNPVDRVAFFPVGEGRKRYLSREEQVRLLATCNGTCKDAVLVALQTGLRRGELLGLKVENLNFDGKMITVYASKTMNYRLVPMTPDVEEVLRRRSEGEDRTAYVFRKADGSRFYGVRTSFIKATKRAGLEDLHFHDLRHTFASELAQNGVSHYALMRLMGHKSFKTTQQYAHLENHHYLKDFERIWARDGQSLPWHKNGTPPEGPLKGVEE